MQQLANIWGGKSDEGASVILYWLAGLYIGWLDCIGWIVSLYRWISLDMDRIGWIDCIGLAGLAGLGHNGWMRTHSFCKDGMDELDGALVGLGWDGRLLLPAGMGAAEKERHHWLASYYKQGRNGTDGLDGALVGRVWDGRTLAGAGTGAPPWATEQECHCWLLRGSALCEW